MQEDEVVKWGVQICDVLEYLHGHEPQPVIFRDMKPSNIIVSGEGKVTLIDFGIAKVFQSDKRGTMIGTEGYAPPEQYRGLAEPRGDLYALGATMHHLLTNFDPRTQTPFTFHERPIRGFNSRVSEYIESVILRACEYDIDRRWPNARALRQALMQSSIFDSKLKRRNSGPIASEDDGPSSLLVQSVPSLSGSAPATDIETGTSTMRPSNAPSGMLVPPSAVTGAVVPRSAPLPGAATHVPAVSSEGAQLLWNFTADDEVR